MTQADGMGQDERAKFDELQPKYEKLCGEVQETLESTLDAREVKVHSVTSRTKTWDSFMEKVNRKAAERRAYADPWTEVEDIAGIRVICLYREDIDAVSKVMSDEFECAGEAEDHDERVDQFGYQGRHFVVTLPEDWRGPHYDDLKGLKCEVQVRTILMDAWASVSHHIDYKTEAAIPEEYRRDFHALSGLLWVADTQFQGLLRAQRQSQEKLSHVPKKEWADNQLPINHDTLSAYLDAVFPHDAPATPEDVSRFVRVLRRTGYPTISQVAAIVNKAQPAMEEVEAVLRQAIPGPPALSQTLRLAAALIVTNPAWLAAAELSELCANDVERIARKHGLR